MAEPVTAFTVDGREDDPDALDVLELSLDEAVGDRTRAELVVSPHDRRLPRSGDRRGASLHDRSTAALEAAIVTSGATRVREANDRAALQRAALTLARGLA